MKRYLILAVLLSSFASFQLHAAAQVTEAKTGRSVVDRKIVDETSTFTPGEKAYLWLRVEGAADDMLTVTWQINGQEYPVTLKIGASPWRTWASKTMHIAGEWTVTVTDAAGTKLHEARLTVK